MQPFEQLEHEFGVWLGNPNCVAVSSGTSALHLACEVLCIEEGLLPSNEHEIAMPDMTMVACPRAAAMAGLVPVFYDCHDNLLMSSEDIRGMDYAMAVHVYGRKFNVDELLERVPYVIEDMAEAHGIFPHVDSFAACWSFYKNKIVHGEEGGMIAFKYRSHANFARELRSLGFNNQHNFYHRPRGVNARMSNLHATPILDSFRSMKENLITRAMIVSMYDALLPSKYMMPSRTVDWVYDIRVPGMTYAQQDVLVRSLNQHGIAARHAFKPMSSQVEFKQSQNDNALRLSKEVIYLPVTEYMTLEDVEKNMKELKFWLQRLEAGLV